MAAIETPSGKTAADENFPVGSRLIRAELRPDIHSFYRFARAADDIADNSALSPEDKVRRLDQMAAVVTGTEAGESPAATQMRESLAASALGPQHCLDLLTAFRLDATKLRYESWSELMEYCRYSAAPVGRQVLDLHGESPACWPSSDALCAVLQIVNHLQDCADDYRNLDRVYIPLDHLRAEGATVSDLAAPAASPGLWRTLAGLLDKTEALMATAEQFPPAVADFRLRCETAIIVELAKRLIARLRREDPLARRVRLSKADILVAAGRGLCRAMSRSHRADTGEADTGEDGDALAISQRVRAAGTSFYLAMRLLPAKRRAAMYAIYAFCRDVDDIADEPAELSAKQAGLTAWRVEIDALYANKPTRAITRALAGAVRRYRLHKEDFLAVIDGMEMDARDPWRVLSMAELDAYCDRVAGAVGHLSVRAFGANELAADRVAVSLGRALQLTNILRDLSEDAERGRLYLPRELLAAHGIAGDDPQMILAHPNLPRVCAALAEVAERHFEDAWRAMRLCRRRAMRPAAVMGAMYWAILLRLRKRGWHAVAVRPKIPTLVKLGIVLRYGLI